MQSHRSLIRDAALNSDLDEPSKALPGAGGVPRAPTGGGSSAPRGDGVKAEGPPAQPSAT